METTTSRTTRTAAEQVPTASVADTARALTQVFLPVAARGAIIRRPRVVAGLQRMDADARAVTVMQHLRDTYGPGPVQLRLPGRRLTFVLDPDDVHRVLNGSPEPFRPDTREKRGALDHFQPDGVLVSSPTERAHRRPFNEDVLNSGRTLHSIAGPVAAVVEEEVGALLEQLEHERALDWPRFSAAWDRVVRRVVLGDSARDDEQLTRLLVRLRENANSSFLRPKDEALRDRFLGVLGSRLARAEPGSLAEVVAQTPHAPGTNPVQQVPQWLFAFDAAAWATFRGLALLHVHPAGVRTVREELDRSAPDLPYARSTVLESLRLWPTTPAILRDTSEDTTWRGKVLPAGASVIVFAPFFHRDETRVPEAHRFAPELWLRERGDTDHPLVPFSGGPAMCPGRNFTLMVASQVLSRLSAAHTFRVEGTPLAQGRPMPGTLSPFTTRLVPQRA